MAGQVRLPIVGSLISPRGVPRRWSAGHIAEDGRDLFVTTGIGTSILAGALWHAAGGRRADNHICGQ